MASGSRRSRRIYRRLAADVGSLGLPVGPGSREPVTDAQLDGLPVAAQRYLRFTGVIGRPADWSVLVHVSGKFRLRPRERHIRAWLEHCCPSLDSKRPSTPG